MKNDGEVLESTPTADVLVIGAGPAGLSAAVWCRDLGLSVVIVEAARQPGGQLTKIFAPIQNYPGVEPVTPQVLKERMIAQAQKAGARILLSQAVEEIDFFQRSIGLQDGRQLSSKAVIIATGVRRRRLGVSGEMQFDGKGILGSGVRDKALVARKSVAVIGGGDAALENALIFAESANLVTLLHRSSSFTARSEFLSRVRDLSNVRMLENTRVLGFVGEDHLTEIEVETDGMRRNITVDAALIRIGVQPNTELFEGLNRDDQGYIVSSSTGETNIPFVYAVGDVALPTSPTIAAAVGMGSAAAKHLEQFIRRRSETSS